MTDGASAETAPPELRALVEPVSPWRIARAFALVGLTAFGGVMPWVYRTVVEKERWLDKQEFAELASMGMLLPGATTTNMATMLGYRLAGTRGAFAAAVGLLTPPFVIVLFMAVLYQHYGAIPAVHGGVRGITAVASGLVIATAIKLVRGQPRQASLFILSAAAFAGVTVLHWPLLAVVGVLIPVSLGYEWTVSK